MQGSNTFQIKTMKKHTVHPRRYRMNAVTSTWVANKYMDRLIDDPKIKVKAIRKFIRREFGVFISNVRPTEQSGKPWSKLKEIINYITGDYCEMVLRTNTGSPAKMEVERTVANSPAVFHRLFIMFDTQRRGFISGCRPVIGLDACHLKGPYGGQLMHALGSDGNNQMYPIAMAVVEAECNDSWMWFLKLMIEVIRRPEDMGWVFISDRQKGLVETFNTLMPRAEHRFRVRHLYANFKLLFKGKDLKDLVWGLHLLIPWRNLKIICMLSRE
ncbi:hypothetical protein ACH5RR_003874 [Cinchona calisaya]|uniref:MULE transposase domain-containing protein n=1 Tax=Cinchona calisaya TaxID=153742 RepID=A0ABD3AWI7_9GENT